MMTICEKMYNSNSAVYTDPLPDTDKVKVIDGKGKHYSYEAPYFLPEQKPDGTFETNKYIPSINIISQYCCGIMVMESLPEYLTDDEKYCSAVRTVRFFMEEWNAKYSSFWSNVEGECIVFPLEAFAVVGNHDLFMDILDRLGWCQFTRFKNPNSDKTVVGFNFTPPELMD